jgi:hypothetical protein
LLINYHFHTSAKSLEDNRCNLMNCLRDCLHISVSNKVFDYNHDWQNGSGLCRGCTHIQQTLVAPFLCGWYIPKLMTKVQELTMLGGVMCRYLQQEICVQSAKRRCMHRFHFVANTFSVKTVCLNGMLFCLGSFKLSSTCITVYVHMRLLNHGIVPALRRNCYCSSSACKWFVVGPCQT